MQKSTYSNIQISLKWLLTAYYRKVMQSKRYLLSYLVTFSLLLAPFQQSIPLGAPILPSQGCQGVLSLHTKPGKKAEDNKYTWNIFDFYQCVNNICMTKQNGSTEHEHKPNWTRFWSLHLVFSFTQGKFRWCHCTWRGGKNRTCGYPVVCVNQTFLLLFSSALFIQPSSNLFILYIENEDLGVKLKETV